jgi:hypothetical protein
VLRFDQKSHISYEQDIDRFASNVSPFRLSKLGRWSNLNIHADEDAAVSSLLAARTLYLSLSVTTKTSNAPGSHPGVF